MQLRSQKRQQNNKKAKHNGDSFFRKNRFLKISLTVAVGIACMLVGAATYANVVGQPAADEVAEGASLYGRSSIGVIEPEPEPTAASLPPMSDEPRIDEETGLPIVEEQAPQHLTVEGDLTENERVEDSIFSHDIFSELANMAEEPDAEYEEAPWRNMAFDEDLTSGMEGEKVQVLQARLIELGYMEPNTLTGIYDDATAYGIYLFQRNHEFIPTGVADVPTLRIIMSDYATLYQMCFNQEGKDILEMQERLNNLGYPVEATGYYDKTTEEQVVAFQKTNGLVEDGVISMGTRAVLFSEAALDGKGSLKTATSVITSHNVGVESLIASAMQQLGKTYVLGGKGPETFDCSGLIYYCLNQSGYQIGYMTSGQWRDSAFATITSMNDLIRGDIICYNGHVGIYLGDGTMIDASSSQGQVRISGQLASSSYWTSNFICGKRVY